MKKTKMVSIGEVYLDSDFFNDEDEGAKTIGQAIIGENAQEIFENRRKVKGLLTPLGKSKLDYVISEIKSIFNTNDVKAVWDKHCGCSMCPCSPGYRIKISEDVVRTSRSKDTTRFNLFIGTKGKKYYSPKSSWEIGYESVDKLKKVFEK